MSSAFSPELITGSGLLASRLLSVRVFISLKFIYFYQGHRDHILATAETRERRQRKLEHFFREAYAITFGLAPGEKRRRNENSDPEVSFYQTTFIDTIVFRSSNICYFQSIVMRTSLSKSEFASALGMKADAVFVKKMFNIVDKDQDGRISFQVRLLLTFISKI